MRVRTKISIVIITFLLIGCSTSKLTLSGLYTSDCRLLDYLQLRDDSTYSIKYSLGSICDGKWNIINDTLFLLDNWKKENIEKKNELIFDENDANFLGEKVVYELNKQFLGGLLPMRFIKKRNKFIGIDESENNYNKHCVLRRANIK